MQFSLAPQAEAAGYSLLAFDSIGSTNSEALDRARQGTPGPLWVVSPHQRSGRGRRGRAWEGPPGNLAASLLLDVTCDPAVAATLGFVAGLAVEQALRISLPALEHGSRLRLKWPNDVLLDGAKLVGILLESEMMMGGRRIVVVGIGINVVAYPENAPYRATSLAASGAHLSAPSLFETLSATWLACHAQWRDGDGLPEIRRQWLTRAAGVGEAVAINTGSEIIRGTFETIDDAGQLVVRQADGSLKTITAGDVHFGAAATAKDPS
jgi:BirA family biotin operon repressor/biotin-[acetyl-CoA-carboxylase] ligase